MKSEKYTRYGSDKTMELQRLQDQLEALQTDRKRVADSGLDTSIVDATIRDVEQQITEVQSQQERIDAQTEMVESITLAYDYNEILGNPLANETIIENIKQFRLQDSEEHFAVIDQVNAGWKKRLDELTDEWLVENNKIRETNSILQTGLEILQENYANVHGQLYTALLEKADAEVTRDNAARLLEEANAELEKHKQSTIENCELRKEIEELKQELTAKKAITVSGNEKLAELAAKAKESTAAAAQRGIERWNQQYGMDIPTLSEPDILPVKPVTETDEATPDVPFQIPTADSQGNSSLERNESLDESVGPNEESEVIREADHYRKPVTRFEYEALVARVDNIERHANIQAVA